MDHDWEQTSWEYDFDAFKCRRCHHKTTSRRGTPPTTPEECASRGMPICIGRPTRPMMSA